MHMGMVHESLSPSMQNGYETDPCAKVFRIRSDGQQAVRSSTITWATPVATATMRAPVAMRMDVRVCPSEAAKSSPVLLAAREV